MHTPTQTPRRSFPSLCSSFSSSVVFLFCWIASKILLLLPLLSPSLYLFKFYFAFSPWLSKRAFEDRWEKKKGEGKQWTDKIRAYFFCPPPPFLSPSKNLAALFLSREIVYFAIKYRQRHTHTNTDVVLLLPSFIFMCKNMYQNTNQSKESPPISFHTWIHTHTYTYIHKGKKPSVCGIAVWVNVKVKYS